MRILHLEKDCYPKSTLDKLEEKYLIDYSETTQQKDLRETLKHKSYNVIFTKLGLMLDEDELKLCHDLQYIVTPTTGHNHLNLEACAKRGIKVISLKGETAFLRTITSTSEHTWGLLLALVRNLRTATADVDNGYWRRKPFMGFDLYSKTIGIIGYGRLGQIVAQYANAFGMNVLANDIDKTVFNKAPNWVCSCDLEKLLIESDIISLHIPYNQENINFLDDSAFAKMQKKPYFINTSRGEVIDEGALLNALKSGKIKAAGLDVLQNDSSWAEKSPVVNSLIDYAKNNNNLIITPHMGGYGDNSIFNTRAFITEKFLKAII